VKAKNTFTCIKGSENVDLPEYLKGAADIYSKSKLVWSAQYGQWYPEMKKETEDALRRLLNGDISPKQCVDLMEQAAAKLRNDTNIIKHKSAR